MANYYMLLLGHIILFNFNKLPATFSLFFGTNFAKDYIP